MVSKVMDFMEKYHMISEGDLVAAGVSGGADSLCLLFMLLEYRKKVPFGLVVVHVNHLIREDASRDAEFVKKICEKENLPFYLKEAKVKEIARQEHLSEEEAGRKVRYEAFEEALKLYGNSAGKQKIAVAHQKGDCAETMLFHLFRGTGIYGMAGIAPVNGKIIRPLLLLDRKEIEEFLKQRNQKWCIDSTNEEDTYTRNKIRHHILDYATKEINEKSVQHIAGAALQMTLLRQYLEGEIEKMASMIAKVSENGVETDIEKWKTYPPFLQSQFLLWAVNQAAPGRKDISEEHILAMKNLMEKTGSKHLDLPLNLEAVKEYDVLWIRRKETKQDVDFKERTLHKEGEYLLEDGSVLEISILDAAQVERIEEKRYTKYFDYDKISSCLSLRLRRAKDYLTINDKGQKKSLKEYFIHEKIPSQVRSKTPLIADENHILWVVGYRISAYYKVTKETKKIVQMTLRRKEHGRKN